MVQSTTLVPVIAGMHRYEKAIPANEIMRRIVGICLARMATIAGMAGSCRSQDSIAGTKSVGAGHARDHAMVQSTTLVPVIAGMHRYEKAIPANEIMRRICWHMFSSDGHNRRRGRLLVC